LSADDIPSTDHAPTDPVNPRVLAGARALVVDDDADGRDAVAAMLANVGAEVRTAGGGLEALVVFAKWWPTLIVCDLVMPEGDGYSFIASLRSLPTGRRVPALVLSGASSDADRARTRAAGFDAHLPKPVEPELLIAALSALSTTRLGDT
jgi:CheY-like chemotaxis protein